MDQRTNVLQQLSAAMDFEHSRGSNRREDSNDTLLTRVAKDTDLRGRWVRYHMIGDALRGQLPGRINADLADTVRAAIDSEPIVLARRHTAKVLLKPLAGLAIAASVAFVAVMGVQRMQTTGNSNSQLSLEEPALHGPIEPASISVVRWDDVSPAAVSRLNSYMVNYSEYRANLGVPGILPYVRIVGSEIEQ